MDQRKSTDVPPSYNEATAPPQQSQQHPEQSHQPNPESSHQSHEYPEQSQFHQSFTFSKPKVFGSSSKRSRKFKTKSSFQFNMPSMGSFFSQSVKVSGSGVTITQDQNGQSVIVGNGAVIINQNQNGASVTIDSEDQSGPSVDTNSQSETSQESGEFGVTPVRIVCRYCHSKILTIVSTPRLELEDFSCGCSPGSCKCCILGVVLAVLLHSASCLLLACFPKIWCSANEYEVYRHSCPLCDNELGTYKYRCFK